MEKIPDFESTVKIPKLKPINLGGYEFLINPALGYYPFYSIELRKRVKATKANNNVITGEGGIGKTYIGSDICRVLSKHFDVDDIVFRYPEFLRGVLTSRRGLPIEFDEPSYAVSKKDWYKEVNKAIVKTIESFRFKGKPLFIPIINKELLEKDIRSYLIQFHVVVTERGKAIVYRLYASQFKAKTYNYEFCRLQYGLFDNELCDIPSCLVCKKLDPSDKSKRCMIFRARYERKKIGTQEERYKIALEEAEEKETRHLNLDEIEAKAMKYWDKFYVEDKSKIDTELLAVILWRKEKIRIGHNKLQRLKKQIEYDHPDFFDVPKSPNVEDAEKA